MNLDQLFIYFIIMSFVGYIYETTAMMLWNGKWENRGFLYGPIIPIYGFGSVIGVILCDYILASYTPLMIFVVSFVFSIVLEYPTSYVLEKLFHAVWWDYSQAPLNINGRVSLFTSLGFGIAGLVIVYIINPLLVPAIIKLSPLVVSILSKVFMCLLTADLTLTISILCGFENRINQLNKLINENIEAVVDSVNPKGRKLKRVFFQGTNSIEKGVDALTESLDYFYNDTIKRIKRFKSVGADTITNLKNEIKSRVENIRK